MHTPPTTSSSQPDRTEYVPLALIVLLAAGLRIYGLATESLWLDEGYTFFEISRSWSTAFFDKTQGPIFIILVKLLCGVFGSSEWTLRLLPAIFGIACIPAIFVLTRKCFDSNTALFASLLAAVNPSWIYYSQDARPYTLLLFAVCLSLWALMRWVEQPTTSSLLLFLSFTLIVVYSHAFGPLILPTVLGWLLIYQSRDQHSIIRERLKIILPTGFLLVALSIPALLRYSGEITNKLAGDTLGGWIQIPPLSFLYEVTQYYFVVHALAVAACLPLLYGLFRECKTKFANRRPLLAVLCLYGAFVAIPWLISRLITPVSIPRYTLPASIAVLLAVAWAVRSFPSLLRILYALLLLSLTATDLYSYYTLSDKDPWRETAQVLQRDVKSGDLVIFAPPYLGIPLTFYYHPGVSVDTLSIRVSTPLDSITAQRDRIWLIQGYGAEDKDFCDHVRAEVNRGKRVVEQIAVAPSIPKNPYTYWQAPISVTLFQTVEN